MPAAQRELVEALLATGKPVIVGADGRQRARASLADGARGGRRSTPGTRAPRAGTPSPTCCSATSTRPDACPITIYRSAADLPPFADYAMRGRTYRYFDGEPLYGFGYGLSYTTFRYTQIGAVAGAFAAAAVEIENTGSRAGRRGRPGSTSSRATPRRMRRAAGWRGSRASRSSRASVGWSRSRSAPTRSPTSTRRATRRPLDGDVDIAVGGQQPERDGRYATRPWAAPRRCTSVASRSRAKRGCAAIC